MKAISLFSGAGGMDVGFQETGVEVVWANELDADAARTYRKNHANTHLCEGDIKLCKEELRKFSKGDIDIVFGGPPCQGFSVAGKMNPDDDRSKLVWEFLDVVGMVKPSVFVMENVKALGELARWAGVRKQILALAESMGYSCFLRVLNAADFGVPQKRERVFFVGFLNCEHDYTKSVFNSAVDKQIKPRTSLRECFSQLPPAGSEGNPLTCSAKISLATSPVMRKSPYAGMLFNGMGRPLDLDNQSNTLPASMGGNKTPILDEFWLKNPSGDNWIARYHSKIARGESKLEAVVPPHMRRITAVEAAAIQTFPLDYEFSGEKSSVYRQIGNAVPCKFAAAIATATMEAFSKVYVSNMKTYA